MRPVPALHFLVLATLGTSAAAQTAQWVDGYAGPAAAGGMGLVVHDAGTGPELFAAGNPPSSFASLIARFDGGWRTGDAGLTPFAQAVSVDFGSGARIVGTTGIPGIVGFSSSTWYYVGSVYFPPTFPQTTNQGTTGPIVAWNDGTGVAVYVGGRFVSAQQVNASHVARYDGATWSPLGAGVDAPVTALAVHDDGSGAALYAGGPFTVAGGVASRGVARWRNGSWSAVPGLGVGSSVTALCVFDDGAGPQLFAAGSLVVNGAPTLLAAWDGAAWNAVGAPLVAKHLLVHDDGGGSALFAASNNALARHRNGWTTLPMPGASAIGDLASHAGLLWISGTFAWSGPDGVANVQTWDGNRFRGAFAGLGTNGPVYAARAVDVGSGPELVVGGAFERAGSAPARFLARFDGARWSGFSPATNAPVTAIAAYDDGAGPRLFVGGQFDAPISRIGRWDGASWSALGGGMTGPSGTRVSALHVFDDGAGLQLYAGGVFSGAGGTSVSNIARWNGGAWSPVGAGFGSPGFVTGETKAFATYDEGAGPRLFAAGRLMTSGATQLNGIGRWDGTSWTSVGGGSSTTVHALCVHDDGTGPALYAAGSFDGRVKSWNGTSWRTIGSGFQNTVFALGVHDDGTGPKLYAGTNNGSSSITVAGVHRWDGSTWTPLDAAPGGRSNENIAALVEFDDASSDPPALFALGTFSGADVLATNVAKYSRATEDVPVCVGDGSGAACPCGNASAPELRAGCLNSVGLAGTLRTTGAASTTADTLTLVGSAMPGSSSALYFQGTLAIGIDTGAAFGDGLRCAGGTLVRLGTAVNTAGASLIPDAQHPAPLSSAGSIPLGGGTRVYQVWYRNAASYCTPQTFNLTNGLRILWRP